MDWKCGLCVVAGLALIGGCGPGENHPAPPKTVALKQAPTGEGKVTGELTVLAFQGGYGLDFYQQAAKEFEAQNPGLTVKVDGSPDVADQVRAAMLAGNPPDLAYPSWKYDIFGAVGQGQLMLLDEALDSPPAQVGGPTPQSWRETFDPKILKLGQENGHQLMLPYFFSVWGWWYDPGVFAKNGWQPPKTYEELLALCEKIKAKGVAPITFQGKYPYYMIQGMLLPWAQDIGGMKVIDDIQNLVPGAWKNPAVLEAAKKIAELRDKGYLEDGAVGLTHTESQTEFLTGKAAMIPCGTWLESEMRKSMPPGAKMQYLLPPVVKGKGDPTAICIEIEPWMVPVKAKNPEAAVAFYKYMTAPAKARQFVEQKSTLMSIKGSGQVKLPETLVVPAKYYRQSKTVYSYIALQWYKKMETSIEGALTSMLNGELTPEQFCERAEEAAEAARSDNSVTKHKLASAGPLKSGPAMAVPMNLGVPKTN